MVSIAANKALYDEIRRQAGMCDALRDLLKEEIAEEKKKAWQEGIKEGIQGTLLETIKNLMLNMKWTAEQAMAAMSIPAEQWESYKAKL